MNLTEQEKDKIIETSKLVLNLNIGNRNIFKQAYEEGWITKEQYELVNNTYYKKEKNDEKRYN